MPKTIRSHRDRVKEANHTLKTNPRYNCERISFIDREAFVEFFLLEDIENLYKMRLAEENAYIPQGRADEKGKIANMEKFSAIIGVFRAAIGAARAAIDSGDYKKVWKAIHERPLMHAANSVKNLPELRELAIELLRELSADTLEAVAAFSDVDENLHDLNTHEENVRRIKDLPPTKAVIEEVIRVAEAAIPDNKRRNSRLESNM